MRDKHAFVPGDLVRWRTEGANMPKEWQLGLVIGSQGGLDASPENFAVEWFRVTVFWMECADLSVRFDTHPVSALVLV